MSLDQLIKDTNKKFKNKIVQEGVGYIEIPRIPFNSPRLNYMLYGGLPMGKIVEFSGEEGSGKTTTALDAVASAQKLFPEKRVLYADCENTLDVEWATKLGVDLEKLILLQPDTETAEQVFDIVLDFLDTGEISIAVIDSLGVMISAQAYAKTMEEKTYGGISSALTLFSKKAVPIVAKHKAILIGINQLRDDMNSSYGGTVTTGGRAWRHHCSVRLQFQRGDYIDEKGTSLTRGCENPAGNLVKCSIVKTKVCRPDRKIGFYTLKYLEGIDYIADIIDVAMKEKIITAAGAWYTIWDPETGEAFVDAEDKPLKLQGRAAVKDYLLANPDDLNYIKEEIMKRIV